MDHDLKRSRNDLTIPVIAKQLENREAIVVANNSLSVDQA